MTLVLGLLGGIGSGKSSVSNALARHGAVVLDADRIGHDVLELPQVGQKLVQRWGNGILFNPNSSADNSLKTPAIDRKKIAAVVFGDTEASREELNFLNSVVHPEIRRRIESEIQRLKEVNTPLVVLDAPLLLETGWSGICDLLLYIDVTWENRWKRVQKRNWTQEEFILREKNQISIQEKRKISRYVIDNNESYEKMEREVDSLVAELTVKSGSDPNF